MGFADSMKPDTPDTRYSWAASIRLEGKRFVVLTLKRWSSIGSAVHVEHSHPPIAFCPSPLVCVPSLLPPVPATTRFANLERMYPAGNATSHLIEAGAGSAVSRNCPGGYPMEGNSGKEAAAFEALTTD